MTPLCALSAAELGLIARLMGDNPVFRVYLAAGLEAERRGARNRFALIGRERRGAALGVAFEAVDVVTVIGELAGDEAVGLAAPDRPSELHLEPIEAERIAGALGLRITHRLGMRYYRLDGRPCAEPDQRCRRLDQADLEMVRALFQAHYPATIFSDWMLDQPFVGLFDDDDLLALGGVVSAADGIANIGNFLTRPDRRGRGLARAVAATLAHALADSGVGVVTLGTTEDNRAAQRAYEAIGFRCFDRRAQIGVAAA